MEDGDGAILPTWTAVDANNVKTSRELWEHMRNEGWRVEVSVALAFSFAFNLTEGPFFRSTIGQDHALLFLQQRLHFIRIPISPDRPIEVSVALASTLRGDHIYICSGQLPGCLPPSRQENRSTEDISRFLVWYGGRTNHICYDCCFPRSTASIDP